MAGVLVQLKACPRCRGDLVLRYDPLGDVQHYNCIQCGYYLEVLRASDIRMASAEADEKEQPGWPQSAA